MAAVAMQAAHSSLQLFLLETPAICPYSRKAPITRLATIQSESDSILDFVTLQTRKTHEILALWATLELLIDSADGFPLQMTPDAKTFIVDTGASITITPSLHNKPPSPVRAADKLKGITAGLMIKGHGTSRYTLLSDDNTLIEIVLPNVLYLPDCCVRLLCL